MISFLLLTFLLMFVVARSPAIYRIATTCLKAIPSLWFVPTSDLKNLWVRELSHIAPPGPPFAPSFQRPPPLFS